jgi:hypothetical protein
MKDEFTVKVSKKAHEWLTARKASTGASIKFIIDLALEKLNGKPIKEEKKEKN